MPDYSLKNKGMVEYPPMAQTIKKLSEFGEGFRHHHENYQAQDIAAIRETGGVLEAGGLAFHFPEHFGFCYGVDKAIDMVFETCSRFSAKERGGHVRTIYLTDQLIHNPYINGKLKEKGVRYLKRDADHLLECEGLKPEDVVVVSAFGTDFRDIERLRAKNVTIVDSTCGAIINVWKRVERYAKDGFTTIMHGKRNHEETRATVSQAVKEGGSYITIENKEEALELAGRIRKEMKEEDCQMGMANQTTMLKGESLEIQKLLRAAFVERFGEEETKKRFRSFDTICGATQDRQDALRKLLEKKLDLLLIVGGFNSSNTGHLAEISVGRMPFYHIEGPDDLLSKEAIRARDPKTGAIKVYQNWLEDDPSTRRERAARSGFRPAGGPAGLNIGITSGASTPDVTLVEIIQKIGKISESST
ncbi:MAG: 4-hydroxy-3-methylbut-2-enyl diphosphate reductase [Candidatus Omnitrophica bacterium]|nr:4-hydroxy-3-methylbut-2-enyl diphosphate reductase [Candidatus Omnitrophota bacterium]